MNRSVKIFVFLLILSLSFFLRFYKLGDIPAGLHADGASQGYNAFSLLQTGKDRYGQSLPILFRSFGSYQPPIYTYLTIIPVALFGNSIFSARFISALAGSLLAILTYFFTLHLFNKNKDKFVLASIAALTVTVAPWSILFSRLVVEANLALLLFVLSVFLFIYSLKKIQFLPIASLILGISTHAYYSERLIAVVFLPLFILLFKDTLLGKGRIFSFRNKKWIILAILLFLITQIPHFIILKSGAFTRRFDQVSYIGNQTKNESKILNIGKTTINNYLIYYSPKNLFFDSDTNIGRTMPGLSVFYGWFLIPFLLGVWYLLKLNKSSELIKIITLLLIITPLPAAFTGDFFYPLRVLDFLWILSLIISIGLFQIYLLIKQNLLKIFLFSFLFLYSLFSLYISYFILFKYEKAENYGYAYVKLINKLSEYKDKQVIIDLARDPGIGVRIAYLTNYPPEKMQNQLRPQLKTPYYSSTINTDEVYKINNIEVKPLSFGNKCKKDLILVGDILTFSQKQIEEHGLKLAFKIQDLTGKDALQGYSTNPESLNNCNQ